MKTKVIAIRLPVDTIAGCVTILSKAGLATDRLPLSSIIRKVLESTVHQQISNKVFKRWSEEEALQLMDGWKTADLVTLSAGNISLSDTIMLLDAEEKKASSIPVKLQEPIDIGTAAKTVISSIDKEAEPDISTEVEIDETADKTPVDRTDLYAMPFTTFEDIQKVAPQDRLIVGFLGTNEEEAGSEDQMELYQRCIEVIYHSLDSTEWGTTKAQRLIQNLYQDYM